MSGARPSSSDWLSLSKLHLHVLLGSRPLYEMCSQTPICCRERVDKHDELTDQLSPEEWEQFQKLQLEYASLSKEELRGTGTTPIGFLQAWCVVLLCRSLLLATVETAVSTECTTKFVRIASSL